MKTLRSVALGAAIGTALGLALLFQMTAAFAEEARQSNYVEMFADFIDDLDNRFDRIEIMHADLETVVTEDMERLEDKVKKLEELSQARNNSVESLYRRINDLEHGNSDRDKRIEKLESENAELRQELDAANQSLDMVFSAMNIMSNNIIRLGDRVGDLEGSADAGVTDSYYKSNSKLCKELRHNGALMYSKVKQIYNDNCK